MVHVRSATFTEANGTAWSLSGRPPKGPAEWIVTDVAGWSGGSGVRGEVTARIGHGDVVGRGERENRVLTLHGTVACQNSDIRDDMERALSGIAGDGDWGDLTCDDGHAILSTRARIDGAPSISKVGTTALRFLLPLRADSPWLYGPERVTFLQPVGTGVGLVYPLYAPDGVLDYGAGIVASDAVHNDGNATAWPTVLVVGDFPGGWRLIGDSKTVEWPWPTTHASPVEVRMDGSIWIGTSNVTDQATIRQWMSIAPGGSLTPSLAPLQGGTGWAEVHHRDTYI